MPSMTTCSTAPICSAPSSSRARAGWRRPERRRSVVRLSEGPPDTLAKEERLFVDWIEDTLRAIVELAAPDEEGNARAPIHLIFYDEFAQRVLLDGLARHAGTILGATPLYDFVTQLAAFDSPIATLSRPRDPRPEELPDGLPVVAGRGRLPRLRLERGHALSRHLPDPALRLLGQDGAGRWRLARSRGWGAGTPAAPASTARSRSSTPMRPGAISRWPPLRGKDDLAPYRDDDTRPATGVPGSAARGDGARGQGLPRQQADGEDAVRSARPGGLRAEGPHPGPRAGRVRHHRAARRAGGLEAGAPGAAGAAGAGWADAGRPVSGGGSGTGRRRDRTATTSAADSSKRLSAPPTARHTRTPSRSSSPRKRRAESDWSQEGMRFRLRLEMHRRRLRPRRGPGADHAQAGRLARHLSPLDRRQSPAGRRAGRVHPDRQADALRHAGASWTASRCGAKATGRSRPGPRS